MRRWLVAVSVAAVLVSGACGGDDADEARAKAGVEAEAEGKAAVQGEAAAFCSARQDAAKAAAPGATTPTSLSRQTMQEQFAKAKEGLDEMVDHAPAEIEADVRVFADGQKAYIEAFEKANFDVTKLDLDALKPLSDPKFQQAARRVEDYFKTRCGAG